MAISVFPERMNELDREEPEKALGTLESYIHYMCERVEFSLSNFFRQINEYGTSAAGTSIILAAHDNSINQLTAEQTALTQAVGGKAEQSALDDLAGTVAELADTVSGLSDAVDGLDDRITVLADALAALDARVTALENQGE